MKGWNLSYSSCNSLVINCTISRDTFSHDDTTLTSSTFICTTVLWRASQVSSNLQPTRESTLTFCTSPDLQKPTGIHSSSPEQIHTSRNLQVQMYISWNSHKTKKRAEKTGGQFRSRGKIWSEMINSTLKSTASHLYNHKVLYLKIHRRGDVVIYLFQPSTRMPKICHIIEKGVRVCCATGSFSKVTENCFHPQMYREPNIDYRLVLPNTRRF